MEFFDYEHIKQLLVYCAFGWMAGMVIYGYGIMIVSGVKWVAKKLKKHFGKNNTAEEETTNE